ncbi:FDXHR family putative zinc-binding protein [Pseudonocardia sp. T1-2H]|uniref:FDXHR family putative zinc-binding protein n=1 Tax=Pseudonocardia sp. T1-2H TaxID=3128899 RepID=UPI0040544E08
MSCCGYAWVGADRAHCCARTGGCSQVFDDVSLFDTHRRRDQCLDPMTLDLGRTRNGIWIRSVDAVGAGGGAAPGPKGSAPSAARHGGTRMEGSRGQGRIDPTVVRTSARHSPTR